MAFRIVGFLSPIGVGLSQKQKELRAILSRCGGQYKGINNLAIDRKGVVSGSGKEKITILLFVWRFAFEPLDIEILWIK